MKPRLAILTTHPIQYYAPVFRLLSQRGQVEVKVFYTWSQAEKPKYDPGFGKVIEWDLPLLDGYDYTFVSNTSPQPGSHHFKGIDNPSLISEIEAWNPGALLVFGWSYRSHLKVLRYFKNRIPVFFRGDSHLLDEQGGIKKILRRVLLRWVYHHIDTALYVGQNNRQYYLKHGIKPDQLAFAPHAIDNTRFGKEAEQRKQEALEWRRSLGIADDAVTFLFTGKLEPKKNPVILLEAFKKTAPPGTHLVFVGNGVLEESLRQAADHRVHFIGFQNQTAMPVVYRMADVFVLPSQGPGETWGLAVNEAMACGVPVLVSDKVGCAVDLVKQGDNGYIFRSNDSADLEDKLSRMAGDRAKLVQMGQCSLQIIEEWSVERLVTAIENVVLKVCN